MKAVTLTDVINKKRKDKEFAAHFQRELLINEIAKMVVQLRQTARLTQKELAEKAGTTQPAIARLESGSDTRIPSLELLTKLAVTANAKIKIAIRACHQFARLSCRSLIFEHRTAAYIEVCEERREENR